MKYSHSTVPFRFLLLFCIPIYSYSQEEQLGEVLTRFYKNKETTDKIQAISLIEINNDQLFGIEQSHDNPFNGIKFSEFFSLFLRNDTLKSIYEYEDLNYFMIPFKTTNKNGYLYLNFSANLENLSSWYMAYRNPKFEQEHKRKKEGEFFRFFSRNTRKLWALYENDIIKTYNFDIDRLSKKERKKIKKIERANNRLVIKDEADVEELKEIKGYETIVRQSTSIKLKPDTEYFLWFSGKSDKLPISYSLYQVDKPI